MLLLALDTSGGLGVAVHDGSRVLAAASDPDARAHAERLAPAVRDALAAAGADRRDVTDVAVGVGPAPFTGLRVGVVTALVLGEALGVPVHGLVSLDAVAASALVAARTAGADDALAAGFVVAADARRREVHWARYAVHPGVPGGVERLGEAQVAAPAAVERDGLPVVGSGAALHPEHLPGPDGALARLGPVLLDPGVLAALAVERLRRGGELLPPTPLYLRRPDAVEPGAPKPALR